jgi:hypothetical protein
VQLGAFSHVFEGATEEAKKQLELDALSTWQFSFETDRWRRIDDSVRRMWPDTSRPSSYYSFLQYWPGSGKLFFLGSGSRCYAVFDLATERWEERKLANKCPLGLSRAHSAWDSRRELLIVRQGGELCAFDPRGAEFRKLPDLYAGETASPGFHGIAYDSKNDVYVATGATGEDTLVCDPESGRVENVRAGKLRLPNGYLEYDPGSDLVVMVFHRSVHLFRYLPGER